MKYSPMSDDHTYRLLVAKMHDVSSLSPQSVGPLSPMYHSIVPFFKHAPWRMFAAGSFVVTGILYLLFGVALINIVSVLQYGF